MSYIEKNSLLQPYQFGFRDKFSTIEALECFSERLRSGGKQNLKIIAILLDLKKAIHSIDHKNRTEKNLSYLVYDEYVILGLNNILLIGAKKKHGSFTALKK